MQSLNGYLIKITIHRFVLFILLSYGTSCLAKIETLCFSKNYNFKANKFNPSYELCCGYAVIERKSAYHFCCQGAGRVYDRRHEFCCGNQVLNHTIYGHVRTCCNNAVKIKGTGRCCHGQNSEEWVPHDPLVSGVPLSTMACCGRKLYDTSKKNCCMLYKKESVTSVVDRASSSYSLCCNLKSYNALLHICKHGNLIPRKIFFQRKCNKKLYDYRIHDCCAGTLYGRDKICCGGIIHAKTNDGFCCGLDYIKHDGNEICCDKVPRNASEGLCCNNRWNYFRSRMSKRQSVCCNKKIMDKDNEFCCNGNIYVKGSGACCGYRLLRNNEICCNTRFPILKRKPLHNSCCYNVLDRTYHSYYNLEQICSTGFLLPVSRSSNNKVCGWGGSVTTRYDPNKQICCDGVINEMPEDKARCCNGKAYKKFVRTPCDMIYCAGVQYPAMLYTCCRNKVLPRSASCQKCPLYCQKQYLKKWKKLLCKTYKNEIIGKIVKVKRIYKKKTAILFHYRRSLNSNTFYKSTPLKKFRIIMDGYCRRCKRRLLHNKILLLTNSTPRHTFKLTQSDAILRVRGRKIKMYNKMNICSS